ncbi:MAG: hypothetical protein M0Z53_00630, partial [Thermaerobacter sp.]|nr:hypothetical protein [Thermaerobacter sp.]
VQNYNPNTSGTVSPWPYRVDPYTGVVTEPYTTSIILDIQLLTGLIHLGYSQYTAVRNAAWQWMLRYPIQDNYWFGYYADVPLADASNTESFDALSTVKYMLQNPARDPNWKTDVSRILGWTAQTFGTTKYGATSIREQMADFHAMGSHTMQWAANMARFYAAAGEASYASQAQQALNEVTYLEAKRGYFFTALGRTKEGMWFADSYFDFLPHIFTVMANDPALGLQGQNHIYSTTDVISQVHYGSDSVAYAVSSQGRERLVVAHQPSTVTINGNALPEIAPGSTPTVGGSAWSYDASTGGLVIWHSGAGQVDVTGMPVRSQFQVPQIKYNSLTAQQLLQAFPTSPSPVLPRNCAQNQEPLAPVSGSPAAITAVGSGFSNGTETFPAAGVYPVTLQVVDTNGNPAPALAPVSLTLADVQRILHNPALSGMRLSATANPVSRVTIGAGDASLSIYVDISASDLTVTATPTAGSQLSAANITSAVYNGPLNTLTLTFNEGMTPYTALGAAFMLEAGSGPLAPNYNAAESFTWSNNDTVLTIPFAANGAVGPGNTIAAASGTALAGYLGQAISTTPVTITAAPGTPVSVTPAAVTATAPGFTNGSETFASPGTYALTLEVVDAKGNLVPPQEPVRLDLADVQRILNNSAITGMRLSATANPVSSVTLGVGDSSLSIFVDVSASNLTVTASPVTGNHLSAATITSAVYNSALNTLTLTFNEGMTPSTALGAAFTLAVGSGPPAPNYNAAESFTWSGNGTILTIEFAYNGAVGAGNTIAPVSASALTGYLGQDIFVAPVTITGG